MTDLIQFEHVVKRFNGRAVLNDLNFSVRAGEVFSIVGPSGTGKSVTLKHIVRLLVPTAGRVCVEGVDVSRCSDEELNRIRGRIGYLFQGGALLAWMTVAENVALPLEECTNLPSEEIRRRVALALAAVELEHAADQYPGQISGGMQKRAGLARAVVRESDIVLYDEPTSGLDPVTSVTINRLIRKLNRTLGFTSIVVTHDLAGALKISDRILLLKNGRAILCATPEEFVRSDLPEVREFLSATKGDWS